MGASGGRQQRSEAYAVREAELSQTGHDHPQRQSLLRRARAEGRLIGENTDQETARLLAAATEQAMRPRALGNEMLPLCDLVYPLGKAGVFLHRPMQSFGQLTVLLYEAMHLVVDLQ